MTLQMKKVKTSAAPPRRAAASSGLLGVTALIGLAACTMTAGRGDPVASAAADITFSAPVQLASDPELPRGVWFSDGYGYVIDRRHEALRAYDATPGTCIEISLEPETRLSDFYDFAIVRQDQSVVRLWTEDEPHQTQYQVKSELPPACEGAGPDATPISVFDHFAAYFTEHYVFFDLFDVDWSERVKARRSEIANDMSNAELFDALTGMIRDVRDAHVELMGDVDGEGRKFDANEGIVPSLIENNARVQSGTQNPGDAGAFYEGYLDGNISGSILKGMGFASQNKYLRYGMATEEIGYIAIFHVARYAIGDDQSSGAQKAAIRQEMGKAIAHFQQQAARVVIVDLSLNFGGFDYVGREIASHFATLPTTTYSKQALDTEALIPPTIYTLEPADVVFAGPIYLLTTNGTVSGGETLSLSLRALPQVTHLGETTRGALSDKLEKPLPNGWEVTLSNELYLDHEGRRWEGEGIPPEIPLQVFEGTADPLASHRDAVAKVVSFAEEQLAQD